MEFDESNNKNFMVKNNIDKANNISLPNGYRFTDFRPGDENNWAYIQYKAGVFREYQLAIRKIFEEQKNIGNKINKCCLFLENELGERIGTVMILPSILGKDVKDIKYLALNPRYHGKGLGKALMAKAFKVINDMEETSRINVEVSEEKAKEFFEELGFEKLVQENMQ